jgi:outer membrane protein assembly factor BamB
MKIAKNKKATLIALFLMLTIAITLVALPMANAHYPAWTVRTWCYVNIAYNPIGVNQDELIVFWINTVPPTSVGAYGDRWTFYVDVTKPDGSNETLGPFKSDPVGGSYTTYAPTQVGTYTFVARFLGQVITGEPLAPPSAGQATVGINDTYSASTSDPAYLTVQQEPRQAWQETPLPSGYWTRPVSGLNRDWGSIMGNWLGGADVLDRINPYTTGPESAHIMWTRQFWDGGVMGGQFGDIGYYTGLTYEPYGLYPPIILNGRLYYNVMTPPRYGWYCVDLRTGEEIWWHNTTGSLNPGLGGGYVISTSASGGYPWLKMGQILNFECPNQHGGFPYLWSDVGGNTWDMFDAFSGDYICSIANVSATGTNVYGKDGSILYYSISGAGANQRLLVWNTTQAIWWKPAFASNDYWRWRPTLGKTFDGRNGFSLNASISPPLSSTTIRAVREDQYVIGGSAGSNNEQGVTQGYLWALNLKPDNNGVITPTLLWNRTFTPPSSAGNLSIGMGTVDPEDGVFLFSCSQTRQRWGYSLETGQQLWKSEPEPQMNYYGTSTTIYQGKLFTCGYGGVLIAYDIMTGEVLWNYTATTIGFESPYGNYPLSIGCIADGKLYTFSTEHSPTQPLWRGACLRCINASDGKELWKSSCWEDTGASYGLASSSPAIADGYIVALNLYDNQIYCYGKGPSAITVTAPQTVITRGQSTMITGTVTDQSSGAMKLAQTLGYANGVPAISDEDQEAWMEYLYMQQARPKDATGVEVSLDTIDPNGNYVHIGTVASDITGAYGYKWTPEVPGTYQIIATFAGSAAYGPSVAQTYAGVDEAPPATAPPEYPQPVDNTMTIVYAAIAIIIAVVLVGIWIRRK